MITVERGGEYITWERFRIKGCRKDGRGGGLDRGCGLREGGYRSSIKRAVRGGALVFHLVNSLVLLEVARHPNPAARSAATPQPSLMAPRELQFSAILTPPPFHAKTATSSPLSPSELFPSLLRTFPPSRTTSVSNMASIIPTPNEGMFGTFFIYDKTLSYREKMKTRSSGKI